MLSNIEYEVGIVMVPDFYYNEVDPEDNPDVIKKNSLKATITYLGESKKDKTWSTKKAFTYEGEKVDTIWMDETITFPYSYRNISKAYPIFQIQSQAITTTLARSPQRYGHPLGTMLAFHRRWKHDAPHGPRHVPGKSCR